jgi:hypothetical protein
MHCHTLYIRIAPARIGLLRFLLEGYNGLAVLSTDDSATGCVRLMVPRSRYAELMYFLSDVAPILNAKS